MASAPVKVGPALVAGVGFAVAVWWWHAPAVAALLAVVLVAAVAAAVRPDVEPQEPAAEPQEPVQPARPAPCPYGPTCPRCTGTVVLTGTAGDVDHEPAPLAPAVDLTVRRTRRTKRAA